MLVTCNGIEIDQKYLYRYLAYSAGYQPPARILSLIDYADHAHHPFEPAYSYTMKNQENIHA